LSWWLPVCSLSGPKVVPVSLAVWAVAGRCGRLDGLELTRDDLEPFGVSRASKSRALKALQGAGLVEVAGRKGKEPLVTVVCPSVTLPGWWVEGEFIRGPLPLRWWGPACRVGEGSSIPAVALAVWFQVGVKRTRENLKLTNVMAGRFGVSPDAKRRALEALEGARLVLVNRRGRKSPLVTIIDPGETRAAA
jgi:DNA-binding transcriptional ArsR family regulator